MPTIGFWSGSPPVDPKNCASPNEKRPRSRFVEPHSNFNAEIGLDRLKAHDLVSALNDAFRQREADTKIAEIGWRGHHHRIRRSVVAQSDGLLLGHQPRRQRRTSSAPNEFRHLIEGATGDHSDSSKRVAAVSDLAGFHGNFFLIKRGPF